MSLPDILAFAVIVIVLPLSWTVTLRLWRLSRSERGIGALTERALTALDLSVVATIFAAVFLNNGMEHPILDPFTTMVLTRVAILTLALPLGYWLFLYRDA